MTIALDTTRAATTEALAEAWHATGVDGDDHALRACSTQSQADVWSDVAQWMTYLAGRPLALDESGAPLLAEAMHADCRREFRSRGHALADCSSAALREATASDAREVLAWLAVKPARTTGARI